MTRPDVACVCVDRGIWAALYVAGDGAGNLIDKFITAHSGPGHVPEVPPRDWHGKEAAFQRHLERLRNMAVPGLSAASKGRRGADG